MHVLDPLDRDLDALELGTRLQALAPGGTLDARLADLAVARTRGLSPRTFHLARAYLLAAIGRSDASEKERTLAARYASGTPADAYFEGILQHAAGNRTEALELLTRAVEESPRGSGIRYRALRARSGLRRREGDWTRALADLHVLLDQGDDRARVTAGIATMWRRLDQPAEAERWFEEALRHARAQGTVSAWVRVCFECRQPLSWFDRATKEALSAHPDAVEMLSLRAAALLDDGRPEEAYELCRRALDLDPTNADWHHSLAITLLGLERYQDALAALGRTIELDGSHVGAHRSRGNVLTALGRFDEAFDAFDEAEQLDPANPTTYVSRGAVLANDLRRYTDALEQFDRAVRFAPRQVHAHLNRCIVLRKLGRHEEALQAVDRAIAAAADGRARVGALAMRGWVLVDLSRYEDALEFLDGAIRRDPTEPGLLSVRSAALWRLKRHGEALETNRRAIDLESRQPSKAKLYHDRGHMLAALERFEDAVTAYEEASRLDPNDFQSHRLRGVILHDKLRRHEEALAAFEAALRLDPKHAGALFNKAFALRSTQKYDDALEAIGEAIELDPDNPHLHVWRGELLNDCFGRHRDALRAFKCAIDLKPDLARAHRNRGIALKALERYSQAVKAFDHALAIDDRDKHTHFMRGASLYLLENHEEAVKSLARSVELDPSWAPAHSLLGSALMALGKDDEGLAAFGRAIDLAPKNAVVRHDRGQALADLGRHEEALEDLEIVVRLQPGNANAHYNRGRSLHALRRYEQAVEAYDTTLQHDRRHEECRRWRAVALRELQRFEHALRETERRLRRRPKDPWARDERSFLLACLGRFGDIVEPEGEAGEPWVRALAIMGRFEDALRHARKLDDPHARVYCLRATGRADAARALACKATKGAIPKADRIRFAYLCAAAGEDEKARAALDVHDLPWHPFDMYERVRIHCLLGETEAALEWLGRAVDKGLRWPANMAPDPDLKPIAGEPRYRSLLERMHRRRLSPAAGEGKR